MVSKKIIFLVFIFILLFVTVIMEKMQFYVRKARFARKMAIRGGLEKVKGIYLLGLLILSLAFLSPRLTGNVVGMRLSGFDYFGLGFFVLFLLGIGMKVYLGGRGNGKISKR